MKFYANPYADPFYPHGTTELDVSGGRAALLDEAADATATEMSLADVMHELTHEHDDSHMMDLIREDIGDWLLTHGHEVLADYERGARTATGVLLAGILAMRGALEWVERQGR